MRGRGGGPASVASVLDRVLAELRLEERSAEAEATAHWEEVVGPEVSRRTRAVGVRRREMTVEVSGSVWMGHLAVLRQGILEALNRRLPEPARLRAIRLRPMRTKEERTA